MKRKLSQNKKKYLLSQICFCIFMTIVIVFFFNTQVSAQVKLKSPDYEIILYPPIVENDGDQKIESGLLDKSEITKLKINGYQMNISENVVNLSLNSNNISWDDDKEIEEKFLVVSTNSTNKLYISSKESKDTISDGKLPLFRCMNIKCKRSDVLDSTYPVVAFSYFSEKSKNLFEEDQIVSLSKSPQVINTKNTSIGKLRLLNSKKVIPNDENKLTSGASIFSRSSL